MVETISSVREVAKEARAVIANEDLYSAELLDDFTDSLIPAFQETR